MRKFIKIICLILTLLILFSVWGCGEYNPATNGSGGTLPPGSIEQPDLDDDPTNDFTVRLRLNGEAFIPTVATNVYWNDGYNIFVAPMDSNGVATIDGLDGDYKVTLSATPSGYTYNPNEYKATNDFRNVVIDMYDSGTASAKESNLYNSHVINETGVYTVTIDEDLNDVNEDGKFIDVAYFEFVPQVNGVYTIESWVNVTEDSVNPICLAYLGSFAYKHGEYQVESVGVCGSYTRNFIHTVKIADENIGSSGSQSFSFAITAQTKSGVYPVTFSFAIKRNDGFDIERPQKTTIAPEFDWTGFDWDSFKALAGSNKVSAKTLYPGTTNSYVFAEYEYESGKYNYKVWEKEDGGDGIYHVYNEELYPETNGYGPMLFAYIDEPCDYLEVSLTTIEDAGNNALVVNGGTENYRQFIKGFKAVAEKGHYCTFNCPCHTNGTPLACLEGCQTCTPQCRPCPENLMNKEGYKEWCNDDGVAPVTPELKEFLQKFAISGGYFADGEGHVDRTGVYAYEDAQWLFACGYYE